MYYHCHMTMTGTSVPAVLRGQLDGRPVEYQFAPGEQKRISFDAVKQPHKWGECDYGVTYETAYLDEDGRVLTRFSETRMIHPDTLLTATQE